MFSREKIHVCIFEQYWFGSPLHLIKVYTFWQKLHYPCVSNIWTEYIFNRLCRSESTLFTKPNVYLIARTVTYIRMFNRTWDILINYLNRHTLSVSKDVIQKDMFSPFAFTVNKFDIIICKALAVYTAWIINTWLRYIPIWSLCGIGRQLLV